MSKKVYVVSGGSYSDYHIKRIFLNKEKAEAYIKVCDDGDLNELEEYELSDDEIFIPAYCIKITYYLNGMPYYSNQDIYDFKIVTTNTTDTKLECQNYTWYYNYGSSEYLTIIRPIYSNNFDETQLKEKYKKVCEDLKVQIESLKKLEGWDKDMISEWLKNKQTIIPTNE